MPLELSWNDVAEFIRLMVLPFGGISIVLVGLAAWMGNIYSKRIINGELAAHKLSLEGFKVQTKLEVEALKNSHGMQVEGLKKDTSLQVEGLRNEIQKDLKIYDLYTSLSKEKFQDMFERRINVYQDLLVLKNEIEKSRNEDIQGHFFGQTSQSFAEEIKRINAATRKDSMLVSNELATLSEELFNESSKIFVQAGVKSTFLEDFNEAFEAGKAEQFAWEAEEAELDNLYSKCGNLYGAWFTQLEKDVARIRKTLDITHDLINNDSNAHTKKTTDSSGLTGS